MIAAPMAIAGTLRHTGGIPRAGRSQPMRFAATSAAVLFAASASASADTPPDCGLYTYRGEIVRVIDGDTVVADIDLGFNVWLRDEHLRLVGIDAPERGSRDAEAATRALRSRVDGRSVYLCTRKMKTQDREARGSFGRYLVTIHVDGIDINRWLLDRGFAVPWEE